MRKLVAIACLTTFIALQYGRLISYWHCRYMVTTATSCDCEKILAKNHQQDGSPHATTAPTIKLPAEETWCFDEIILHQTPVTTSTIQIPVYTGLATQDYAAGIFQPPRIGYIHTIF
jgi:hypothetical protein